MSISKNSARQFVVAAEVEINFSDVSGSSGVAVNAIQLPANAMVVGGYLATDTAFNSATSDTIAVTDPSGGTILAASSVHAAGGVALTPKGGKSTTQGYVTVTWTGVGAAPTAGKCRLCVTYIQAGRADFSQG